MDFAMVFGLSFWAGVFISWWVYYYRAGLSVTTMRTTWSS
jgi:hypothetical protein